MCLWMVLLLAAVCAGCSTISDDEPDFRMLAISREENEESVAAYWAANGLLIPYSPQEDRRIYNLFATSIIPRIYFCRDGIVTRIDIEKFSI